MMKKELGALAKELVRAGRSAEEIKDIAGQYISSEELEALWRIPRQNIIDFVRDSIENMNLEPPFLDMGCGKRSYKPEVVEKLGADVFYIAFDHFFPEDEVDLSRAPNVLADCAFIPLSSSSVGTLICTEVLEHVEDDGNVLEEIHRVMRENGKLILTLPGRDIPKHEKLPYQVDYRRYSPEEARQLLEARGFNILRFDRRTLFDLEINLLVCAQKF